MVSDVLDNIYTEKYYSAKTVVVASLFGGLIASGYMIYQNFKKAGDLKMANISIIFSVLCLAILIISGIVPGLERVPGPFYSIFFTLLTSVFASRYQRELIAEKVNNGAKYHPTSKAIAICLISILCIVALVLGAFFLQDMYIGSLTF